MRGSSEIREDKVSGEKRKVFGMDKQFQITLLKVLFLFSWFQERKAFEK